MIFTPLGCLVLIVGVAFTLAWATMIRNSPDKTNELHEIKDGEIIARVKADDKTFPALLIHRKVASAAGWTAAARDIDQFVIGALSLQETSEEEMNDAYEFETNREDARGSVQV